LSELDFSQKVEMRRAFWAAGASTRVDVKLGALVDRTRSKTRARSEDWTDLDVLAVDYSPVHGASFTVADCKTVKGRATERVFWLRGVADLFDARAAYLTRDGEISAAARQLALRLGIAAMDANDRRALSEQLGDRDLPTAGNFLDAGTLLHWMKLTTELPQSVDRLQRYRQTYYWLQRPRRNLTALPTALSQASAAFVPEQRWALAVLVDLAWLYLLSALGALDDITRLHLSDVPRGLAQSVLGGEQERREKEVLADQLKVLIGHIDPEAASRVPKVPILPPYFDDLVDLVARIARRRTQLNGAMRCLEFVGVESVASKGAAWADGFPDANPVQAKLSSDVLRFLTKACGLAPDFVNMFDALVQPGNLTSATPVTSTSVGVNARATTAHAAPSEPRTDRDGKPSTRQESLFGQSEQVALAPSESPGDRQEVEPKSSISPDAEGKDES
jgi:hypothetical protein